MRKVKVLPLPETIKLKEKSTFRAKALPTRAFARNVVFSFIVSGSERTFTFRVSLNTLYTYTGNVSYDFSSQFSLISPLIFVESLFSNVFWYLQF